ncbi:protein iq-domain 1 [Phtheirospermum japonicum]|uniref:Protein iq-domain 1 n=1 Tax=Phtheirospermum japonicum TaxID=374723 RepID=A0A830BC25_9LAMI|nr:protein iq-domain 1 [Phtheirospermum japonicum]
MGKKGKWFYAVKKVFSCESNKNRRKVIKTKRSIDLASSSTENAVVNHSPREEVKLIEAEIEQNRHAYSVALATAAAAEAAAAAANAAAEVVRLTAGAGYLGKSMEEIAAIKIQTAFRGYLARRALRALRGLVRLKSLVVGSSVKRQAATTLKYMQTLSHVQSEIRARRIRMSEQNSALQRQIQQKREKELEKLRLSVGEDWDDSMQSKERIEANIQHKQEAAVRRERALAYAYTHQQTWRNTSNSANQTFMDPNNPHWGWSWLERWMASRQWDNGTPVKSTTSVRGNAKLNSSPTPQKQSRPLSRQSPSTPKPKAATKFRPASPRGTTANGRDDDSKSINSAQSDRCRRHSVAGSSVRDDESLASSPAVVQSYMASTESARARARLASPLGGEKVGSSAKKRLSFSGSPGRPRRHSGPPRVDISPMKDLNTAS